MPLVFAFSTVAGCQEPSEGAKTVNGANDFSLSPLSTNLGGLAHRQIAGPVLSVRGPGAVWKDYEENEVGAEMQWIAKRISIANATVLEVTKHRSASEMMSGMARHITPTITCFSKHQILTATVVWSGWTTTSGLDNAVLSIRKTKKSALLEPLTILKFADSLK